MKKKLFRKPRAPKRPPGSFVIVPRSIYTSKAWRELTLSEHQVLWALFRGFTGLENGRFTVTRRDMHDMYGWNPDNRWRLQDALRGLRQRELIKRITKAKGRKPATYRVPWVENYRATFVRSK